MSLSRTATTTASALLGTIATAANVTNAALNSANIAANDLQERTQNWANTARTERKLSAADSTEVALTRHAQTRVGRLEELQSWITQNPNREAAFKQALIEARELLTTA